MRILTIILLGIGNAPAQEATRDWQAFLGFNDEVNDWLLEKSDANVTASKIKLLFFKFWLMYYGPQAYKDDEAAAIQPFLGSKYKAVTKKLDLSKADLSKELGVDGKNDQELAAEHCPSLRVLRLDGGKLKIAELRRIIAEFESWGQRNEPGNLKENR